MGFMQSILGFLLLFNISNFLMCDVTSILMPEFMLRFGWDSALFVLNLGGMSYFSSSFSYESLKTPKSFLKATIIVIFWPALVNWKQVIFHRKEKTE